MNETPVGTPGRRPVKPSLFLPLGATVLVIAGLAFLVRRWPRMGGVVLLAIFILSVVQGLRLLDGPHAGVAAPSILLQACIFPGAMAAALLATSRAADQTA